MLSALIQLAQRQIAAAVGRGAALDYQALALIAVDGTLAALDVAAKGTFGHPWFAPMPGLAASALMTLFVMIKVPDFQLGPPPAQFFADNADKNDQTALEQLLADLVRDLALCNEPIRVKTGRLRIGLGLLVFTIIYSAGVIGGLH